MTIMIQPMTFMKSKILTLIALVLISFPSCYDDSAIREQLDDHEQRLSELETLCDMMNADLSTLKTIVEAVKANDYVESVTPLREGDVIVGYTIEFAESGEITIRNGKDGLDGKNAPDIGVRKDADGVYYWTLGGEWLEDEEGNKLPVAAEDVQNEVEKGEEGVTPQLKIEDDYWWVSYDNGETWQKAGPVVNEGAAVSDSFFKSVDYDDATVTFTLTDGTLIVLDRALEFDVVFSSETVYSADGEWITIPFEVVGATGEVRAECLSNVSDFSAHVTMTSETQGVIKAMLYYEDKKSQDFEYKIVVLFSNGNKQVIMKSIVFEHRVLKSVQDVYTVMAEGGMIEVEVTTNMDYEVVIPTSAASWISLAETKAVRTDLLKLDVRPLEDEDMRQAEIEIRLADGSRSVKFTVLQMAYINFVDEIIKEQCVTAFDTNGDGELSFEEAAAVTDLTCLSLEGLPFVSFDEFQYFTGVREIPMRCFGNCPNLRSITLPEGLETIGDLAFFHCESLQEIRIPASVIDLSTSAYNYCSSVRSIVVDEDNPMYDSRNDCNAVIISSRNVLMKGCQTTIIPDEVKIIDHDAFKGMFNGSEYVNIEIPEGITFLGMYSYADCPSIRSIKIPSTVTNIDYGAFAGCSGLSSIEVSSENKIYDSRNGCNAIIRTSDNSLISGCKNTVIPQDVVHIEGPAFSATVIENIEIPEGIVSIGQNAFSACRQLKSISIPESVVTIQGYAFHFCLNLKSVTIKGKLKILGEAAFADCEKLTVIHMDKGVEMIASRAFPSTVSELYIGSTTPPAIDDTLKSGPFAGVPENLKIYVPLESVNAYKEAPYWSDYADMIYPFEYN